MNLSTTTRLLFATTLLVMSGCSSTAETEGDDTAEDAIAIKAASDQCGAETKGLRPRFVTIPSSTDQVRLNVVTQGDPKKQAIVLVHGFPDAWCGWSKLIPALSERYFVVVPDMRGYNRSSKPGSSDPADITPYKIDKLTADLDAVVAFAGSRTEGGKKPALVVHDWGAVIGWQYAGNQGAKLATKIDRFMAISVPHPTVTQLALRNPASVLEDTISKSRLPLPFGSGTKTLGKWLTEELAKQPGETAATYITKEQDRQKASLAYVGELINPKAYENFRGPKVDYQPLFERLKVGFFRDEAKFYDAREQNAMVKMWESTGGPEGEASGPAPQKSFQAMVKYYRANFVSPGLPSDFSVTGVPITYLAPLEDGAILYPWGAVGLELKVPNVVVRTVDSGHFAQRENPVEVLAEIRRWMER